MIPVNRRRAWSLALTVLACGLLILLVRQIGARVIVEQCVTARQCAAGNPRAHLFQVSARSDGMAAGTPGRTAAAVVAHGAGDPRRRGDRLCHARRSSRSRTDACGTVESSSSRSRPPLRRAPSNAVCTRRQEHSSPRWRWRLPHHAPGATPGAQRLPRPSSLRSRSALCCLRSDMGVAAPPRIRRGGARCCVGSGPIAAVHSTSLRCCVSLSTSSCSARPT